MSAANRPKRSEKTRIPLGARNRLTFSATPKGFVDRVINDTDGRLDAALDAGYEFVESGTKLGDDRVAEGTTLGSRVSKPVGNGTTGYLMRIRQDWYDETQADKAKAVDKTEEAMQPDKSKGQYGSGLTTDK